MEQIQPATFQEPAAPTPNLVVVTNISLKTDAKMLREFFSFCGEIEELHLIQSGDSQKAIIRFTRESAARTALLLSNAYLGEKNIFVAPYFDDLPPYINQEAAIDPNLNQKETAEMIQEDKPKLSIVVELLANGYVLNDRIIDGAKTFDEKYGVTNSFKRYLSSAQHKSVEINEKYQITMKAEVLAQTAKGVANDIDSTYQVSTNIQKMDEKYHVTEKIGAATTSAIKLAESAIGSETGQKVQGFLSDVWNRAKVINEEAKKKAAEKEGSETLNMISNQDLSAHQDLNLNQDLKDVQYRPIEIQGDKKE